MLVFGTAAIAVIVLLWMLRERAKGDIFGLALILGGALVYNKARIKAWESRHHKWLVSFGQKLIGEGGRALHRPLRFSYTTIRS